MRNDNKHKLICVTFCYAINLIKYFKNPNNYCTLNNDYIMAFKYCLRKTKISTHRNLRKQKQSDIYIQCKLLKTGKNILQL